MGTKLDIVTAEKVVFSGDVDTVVAPGVEGQLGVLPQHSPLMTTLQAGELRFKKGSEETILVITGGFLEVRPDRVVVLADAAERAEEIDINRAEEAKKRAQERLAQKHVPGMDEARAEAALRRALVRLKVAEKVQQRKTYK
ncbi:MAG: F0F1 ATP synthase subunit epsilon [Dehalococcoidales bacterium]|nr:F0F1 ATP synthase subunit epsilon [Dehalococcoidales bacterium]